MIVGKLKKKAIKIDQALSESFPNARVELDFVTPVELLVATILSAQSTDVKVNQVTKSLFLNNLTRTILKPIPIATIRAIISPYNPVLVKLPIPIIIIASIAIKITIHVKRLGISLTIKTEKNAAKTALSLLNDK